MDFAKKMLECLGLNDRLDYVSTALPRISRGVPGMLIRHLLGAPEMILWYTWGTSRIYFNIYYAPETLLEHLGILFGHFLLLGIFWDAPVHFVVLLGCFWTFFCSPGVFLEYLANALVAPRSR